MKIHLTITVQCREGQELPVFESDLVSPEQVHSTFLIAEQTARATVAATYGCQVCVRKYVGPTLISSFYIDPEESSRASQNNATNFVQITNKYSGKALDV